MSVNPGCVPLYVSTIGGVSTEVFAGGFDRSGVDTDRFDVRCQPLDRNEALFYTVTSALWLVAVSLFLTWLITEISASRRAARSRVRMHKAEPDHFARQGPALRGNWHECSRPPS